jgi:methylmalonyl-CoA/ethylmalonyl-CoA epimerase
LKFDHIGLVAATLSEGRQFLSATLNITRWTREFEDSCIGVSVQFGQAEDGSGPWYEIISPLGEKSPVLGTIKHGKNILSHVAYLVKDLEAAAAVLVRSNCVSTSPAKPAVAYGGRKVQFFISPLKFMIELIEAIDHSHVLGGS